VVADIAGDNWPTEARMAALSLHPPKSRSRFGSTLLKDLRLAFFDANDTLSTAEVVRRLNALEKREWKHLEEGQPLTASLMLECWGNTELRACRSRRRSADAGCVVSSPRFLAGAAGAPGIRRRNAVMGHSGGLPTLRGRREDAECRGLASRAAERVERSRAEEMLTACCVPYSWWDPVWREVATLPDTLTRGNAA